MADVRVRNGYVRVANSLWDAAWAAPLTKRQLKVFFAVVRLTYGWRKKHDFIGSRQVAGMIGLDERHVRRALAELSGFNMIRFRTHGGGRRREIEVVKDFDVWDFSPGPKQPDPGETRRANSARISGPIRPGTRANSARLHRHSSTDNKQKSDRARP